MDISIYLLVIVSLILLGLTLLLFLSAVFIRLRHRKWATEIDRYRKKMLPHVLNFLEEGNEKEVEEQFTGAKLEYYAFEKIVTEMLSQVEGNDADKLKKLLFLDPIYDHHYKLLTSKDDVDRVKACNYFSNVQLENSKVIKKLKGYLNSPNQMLVFSAATALMGSEDVHLRVEALCSVAKKNAISNMALIELFHKFHSDEEDQNEIEGEALKIVLENQDITPENRALFIKGITEIGYYNLVDYLLEHLKEPAKDWDHPEILVANIKAQSEFNNIKSIKVMRKYLDHESPEVVSAAVSELSDYGSEEDLPYFKYLLEHSDNKVKKAAVYALLKNNVKETEIVHEVPEGDMESITKYVMMYMNENRDRKRP
ncbi:HEAT repeat domain-containing protein [Gracilimonas sp. Q87]|uniref:HEAT repeat domain-containing protein n=1 Tax=Gracilimonas sp. Q87 TaxID=3384766 RepID=UPI00398415D3